MSEVCARACSSFAQACCVWLPARRSQQADAEGFKPGFRVLGGFIGFIGFLGYRV